MIALHHQNGKKYILKIGLKLGCPKNSKHYIFYLNRTFRIYKILYLEKSQGMKGRSDGI